MDQNTSIELFEAYLNNRGIVFERIDEDKSIMRKKADYALTVQGRKIIVEVKELEAGDNEKAQTKLCNDLQKVFSEVKLGYSFSTFQNILPSKKTIKFFTVFLNRINNIESLKIDKPLFLIMPEYCSCKTYKGNIIIIDVYDRQGKQVCRVISPETINGKYPLPLRHMDHALYERAIVNGKPNGFFEIYSGNLASIILEKNDLEGERILPICIGGSFDNTKQIREDIKTASKQLADFKDWHPCCLVLYPKGFFGIDDFEMLNAIAGTEKVTFRINTNGMADDDVKLVRDRDGALHREKGTRFSTISVLRYRTVPFLRTYHNPFAKIKLGFSVFNGKQDKQIYFDENGQKCIYQNSE